MNSKTYPVYYQSYIDKIPENADPFELLDYSLKELFKSLVMVSEDQSSVGYEEGKWSIKDLVQHLIDTERIFCFRALAFARGDENEIQGYDHDAYVVQANANHRTLKDLLEELKRLRQSTKDLFASFSDEMMKREGVANGQKLSVEQFLYIIIGHEMHHLKIIDTKYL